MLADNYVITERTIKAPPASFSQKLKFLGPGFILSASIVGSGELIATTTLGAKAGFIAFWIIIVSCLVKVAVQLEFGKRAILTGQTAMQSFNSGRATFRQRKLGCLGGFYINLFQNNPNRGYGWRISYRTIYAIPGCSTLYMGFCCCVPCCLIISRDTISWLKRYPLA